MMESCISCIHNSRLNFFTRKLKSDSLKSKLNNHLNVVYPSALSATTWKFYYKFSLFWAILQTILINDIRNMLAHIHIHIFSHFTQSVKHLLKKLFPLKNIHVFGFIANLTWMGVSSWLNKQWKYIFCFIA